MPTVNTHSAAASPYSLSNFLRFINQNFAVLLVIGVGFGVGFLSGSLWTENSLLKVGGRLAGSPTAPGVVDPGAGTEPQLLAEVPPVTDEDHVRGNRNAPITLVEYSDFECPFCARFHPTMQQVLEEYGDQVRWVYRHYPLSFHPNAQKAAEASECVAKEGGNDAFWKYADAIFAENDRLGGSLTPESITTAIQASGANATAVQTCLDSGEMASAVSTDMSGGTASGVTGTPGTILIKSNGEQELISGALPFEQLKVYLDGS